MHLRVQHNESRDHAPKEPGTLTGQAACMDAWPDPALEQDVQARVVQAAASAELVSLSVPA